MDEIEQELGMTTYAVNYPIGTGDRFRGLCDRRISLIHLFQRTAHGSKTAADNVFPLGDSRLESRLEPDVYSQF